jgi:hypothetical protein
MFPVPLILTRREPGPEDRRLDTQLRPNRYPYRSGTRSHSVDSHSAALRRSPQDQIELETYPIHVKGTGRQILSKEGYMTRV